MYKIFINEHPLVISGDSNTLYAHRNLRLMDDDDSSILSAIEMLENTEKAIQNFGIFIPAADEAETFKRFKKNFMEVTAAGGIVFNPKDDLLLIKRQGRWDLPKGKKDEEEKVESAAVREVKEECGIKKIKLLDFVTKSYHTYSMDSKRVLKITHWFKMQADADAELIPQEEENITEVRWFELSQINLDQMDTYNSIREVLKEALNRS